MPDLVGLLEKERSFAESGVARLKRWVKKPAVIAKGQRLYEEAKAAADQAVGYLQAALAEGKEPERDEALLVKLDTLAIKRLAFSQHVDASLPPELRGTKEGVGDALGKAAGEIVKGLITAAVDVWKAFRAADKDRRDTLRQQIGATRWRAFGEVPAA
jgi:hypothetical protein